MTETKSPESSIQLDSGETSGVEEQTEIQWYGDNRDSNVIVEWMKTFFVLDTISTIPRHDLCARVLEYAVTMGFPDPGRLSKATIGKLIRRSFPGLLSRRLGRRGKSVYHYTGIRKKKPGDPHPKPDTELNKERKVSKRRVPPIATKSPLERTPVLPSYSYNPIHVVGIQPVPVGKVRVAEGGIWMLSMAAGLTDGGGKRRKV